MEYNVYESFVESLRTNKVKAVEAFYEAGYITEDEAKELMKCGHSQRNDCTFLNIYDSDGQYIYLDCHERIDSNVELLFTLSYNRFTRIITAS